MVIGRDLAEDLNMNTPANTQLIEILLDRVNRVEKGYLTHDEHIMTEAQVDTLNKALPHCSKKDHTYRPYCLRCELMPRVAVKPFGFECWNCGNKFGFDLKPLTS